MFSALEVIASNPDISQTNLSREVGLDKSVMVAMVDDLEQRGWVKRTRSTNDRRRYKLAITPEGKDTLDALFAELETTEEMGLAALTEEERRIVNEALDKVYRVYVRPQKPARAEK
jgi:DNA-binding MarR family transcriptional regulator